MDNNIILIGYMGCGKSSVGKLLAKEYGFTFLDLDSIIEDKEQMNISTIFKEKGEVYFRKLETSCLKECLSNYSNTILSLGGGTPCFGTNMETILNTQNAVSIYLNTSVAELSKRLYLEKDLRPLIAHTKTVEELTEFVAKHLFERSPYYLKANCTVKTDLKSITTIIDEIKEKVF